MSLRTLRWVTVVIPILFIAGVDLLRHTTSFVFLHQWPTSWAIIALVAGSIAAFSKTVFDQVETMQRRFMEQNERLAALGEASQRQAAQLRALHEAGLTLAADLSLEVVLQRVVDVARQLSGARYGALGVFDKGQMIQKFVTSGMTSEDQAKVETPPQGRGLLGEVLRSREPLLVRDIASHPGSVGFPPGHPQMTSFLGVPIVYKGEVLGNIYLTNKQDSIEFSEADASVLQLFAAQAAVAIENARLHSEVQNLVIEEERQRIAREMHDGLAQVLAYVNMKTGAVRHLVDSGRVDEATRELEQLENAAREVYTDVREAILGLRTVTQGDSKLVDVLISYMDRFKELSGVNAELIIKGTEEHLRLRPEDEVQLIRIIQEALSNVRKHAEAHNAKIYLEADGAAVTLLVEDDGRGFSQDRAPGRGAPHFGLQTMRERAEALGGSFSIESTLGKGTRVTVALPRQRS